MYIASEFAQEVEWIFRVPLIDKIGSLCATLNGTCLEASSILNIVYIT